MDSTILRAFLQVILPGGYEWSGYDWRSDSFERFDEGVDITLKELQQVKEKSQVLLGKQEQHREKMGRMYDFRSRFVHGDLDFSGKRPAYENEDHREHNKELMETICFAEAILVASLQRLVELDWAGPRFTYRVGDSSSMKDGN